MKAGTKTRKIRGFPMDHDYIEQNHVVDRYLMDKLEPGDVERFEAHYLHCQDCVASLELAEKLQQGFKRSVAHQAAQVAAARQLAVVAWLSRLSRPGQLGVLTAGLALALLLPMGLSYQLAQVPVARTDLDVFRLSPERSAGFGELDPTLQISLSPAREEIVLELELERSQYAGYRVTVLRQGRDVIWQGDGLETNHRDALVLGFSAAWLSAGDYLLRVEGLPPGGEPFAVAHYSFRVLPEP